jgi:hypothetical protein
VRHYSRQLLHELYKVNGHTIQAIVCSSQVWFFASQYAVQNNLTKLIDNVGTKNLDVCYLSQIFCSAWVAATMCLCQHFVHFILFSC